MIDPLSSSTNPEAAGLDRDLQAIIEAARTGQMDTQAIEDAQRRMQNLMNDPHIPNSMKVHFKALMADFRDHPSELNMRDIDIVHKDIQKL